VAVASGTKGAAAYAGPFVLDRSHPLTKGLGFDGVVWGASPVAPAGRIVIAAGSVPLLSDVESPAGRHDLTLAFVPSLSTLSVAPAWPALLWNLVDWRLASLPGPSSPNVRLGADVAVSLPPGVEAVVVTDPSGGKRTVPGIGRRAAFRADLPGLYELTIGEARFRVSSLPASASESDLRGASSGRLAGEAGNLGARSTRTELTAVLGLLALAVLTVHRWLGVRKPEAAA
jgi:hypothetical protein